MSSRWLEPVLFWTAFVAGGVMLLATMLLPSWLEYTELQQRRLEGEARLRSLRAEIRTVEKQIEHLRSDPAYVARLARREFGVTPPGMRVLPLGAESDGAGLELGGGERGAQAGPVQSGTVLSESGQREPVQSGRPAAVQAARAARDLGRVVAEETRGNPVLSAFVLPETRPAIILLAWLLLLSAVVIALPGPRRGSSEARLGREKAA